MENHGDFMVMRSIFIGLFLVFYGVSGAAAQTQPSAQIPPPPAGIALTDRPIAPASDKTVEKTTKKTQKSAVKTAKKRGKNAKKTGKKRGKIMEKNGKKPAKNAKKAGKKRAKKRAI